jgi:hypothetical protein
MKQQPSVSDDPNNPPLEYLLRLQHDFIDIHEYSFRAAIRSIINTHGGVDNFDFPNQYAKFSLRYRTECAGNTSVAFRIHAASLGHVSSLTKDPTMKSTLDVQRGMSDALDANNRSTDDTYIGSMRIIYDLNGYFVMDSFSQHRHDFDEPEDPLFKKNWLKILRMATEDGLVPRPGSGTGIDVGRIVKDGNKWRWVELESEEEAGTMIL